MHEKKNAGRWERNKGERESIKSKFLGVSEFSLSQQFSTLTDLTDSIPLVATPRVTIFSKMVTNSSKQSSPMVAEVLEHSL